MCTCKTKGLHTQKCVKCGQSPNIYTGHVSKDGEAIIAGWCSHQCLYSQKDSHGRGHFGEWEPRMGTNPRPVWEDAWACPCGIPTKSCTRHGADLPEETISLPAPLKATAAVVNDHVCPSCGNDRCSKQERSCWKCGNRL